MSRRLRVRANSGQEKTPPELSHTALGGQRGGRQEDAKTNPSNSAGRRGDSRSRPCAKKRGAFDAPTTYWHGRMARGKANHSAKLVKGPAGQTRRLPRTTLGMCRPGRELPYCMRRARNRTGIGGGRESSRKSFQNNQLKRLTDLSVPALRVTINPAHRPGWDLFGAIRCIAHRNLLQKRAKVYHS